VGRQINAIRETTKQMMRTLLILILFLSSLLQISDATAQTFKRGAAKDEAIVNASAIKVLTLLDSSEIGKAWDEASAPLQSRTSRLTFIAGINGMRAAAGNFQSRKLKAIGFLKDLPDAPQGFYSVAFFETNFERLTVEEKLIFYQEGTVWRLAGYFFSKRFKKDSEAEK
jgi:Protein of unknown function (DUF4019)